MPQNLNNQPQSVSSPPIPNTGQTQTLNALNPLVAPIQPPLIHARQNELTPQADRHPIEEAYLRKLAKYVKTPGIQSNPTYISIFETGGNVPPAEKAALIQQVNPQSDPRNWDAQVINTAIKVVNPEGKRSLNPILSPAQQASISPNQNQPMDARYPVYSSLMERLRTPEMKNNEGVNELIALFGDISAGTITHDGPDVRKKLYDAIEKVQLTSVRYPEGLAGIKLNIANEALPVYISLMNPANLGSPVFAPEFGTSPRRTPKPKPQMPQVSLPKPDPKVLGSDPFARFRDDPLPINKNANYQKPPRAWYDWIGKRRDENKEWKQRSFEERQSNAGSMGLFRFWGLLIESRTRDVNRYLEAQRFPLPLATYREVTKTSFGAMTPKEIKLFNDQIAKAQKEFANESRGAMNTLLKAAQVVSAYATPFLPKGIVPVISAIPIIGTPLAFAATLAAVGNIAAEDINATAPDDLQRLIGNTSPGGIQNGGLAASYQLTHLQNTSQGKKKLLVGSTMGGQAQALEMAQRDSPRKQTFLERRQAEQDSQNYAEYINPYDASNPKEVSLHHQYAKLAQVFANPYDATTNPTEHQKFKDSVGGIEISSPHIRNLLDKIDKATKKAPLGSMGLVQLLNQEITQTIPNAPAELVGKLIDKYAGLREGTFGPITAEVMRTVNPQDILAQQVAQRIAKEVSLGTLTTTRLEAKIEADAAGLLAGNVDDVKSVIGAMDKFRKQIINFPQLRQAIKNTLAVNSERPKDPATRTQQEQFTLQPVKNAIQAFEGDLHAVNAQLIATGGVMFPGQPPYLSQLRSAIQNHFGYLPQESQRALFQRFRADILPHETLKQAGRLNIDSINPLDSQNNLYFDRLAKQEADQEAQQKGIEASYAPFKRAIYKNIINPATPLTPSQQFDKFSELCVNILRNDPAGKNVRAIFEIFGAFNKTRIPKPNDPRYMYDNNGSKPAFSSKAYQNEFAQNQQYIDQEIKQKGQYFTLITGEPVPAQFDPTVIDGTILMEKFVRKLLASPNHDQVQLGEKLLIESSSLESLRNELSLLNKIEYGAAVSTDQQVGAFIKQNGVCILSDFSETSSFSGNIKKQLQNASTQSGLKKVVAFIQARSKVGKARSLNLLQPIKDKFNYNAYKLSSMLYIREKSDAMFRQAEKAAAAAKENLSFTTITPYTGPNNLAGLEITTSGDNWVLRYDNGSGLSILGCPDNNLNLSYGQQLELANVQNASELAAFNTKYSLNVTREQLYNSTEAIGNNSKPRRNTVAISKTPSNDRLILALTRETFSNLTPDEIEQSIMTLNLAGANPRQIAEALNKKARQKQATSPKNRSATGNGNFAAIVLTA